PVTCGLAADPLTRRSPATSALMPRPRTEIRLGADIARASVALNSGARALADLALAFSASSARAVAVGLTCFVPGIGAVTLLRRSGTLISIETIVMRPATLGV